MKTVIEMAREAGGGLESDYINISALERFAELVRADEREACAQIAETYREWDDTGMGIAAAIRARSNT